MARPRIQCGLPSNKKSAPQKQMRNEDHWLIFVAHLSFVLKPVLVRGFLFLFLLEFVGSQFGIDLIFADHPFFVWSTAFDFSQAVWQVQATNALVIIECPAVINFGRFFKGFRSVLCHTVTFFLRQLWTLSLTLPLSLPLSLPRLCTALSPLCLRRTIAALAARRALPAWATLSSST